MQVRSSQGFTLMEILVVVFILSLLVSLVAPRLMQEPIKAKRVKAAADIKTISEALHRFHLDNGFYPASDPGLSALGKVTAGSGAYLERIPDDPWGKPYIYGSDGKEFVVKSFANDGQEGGSGFDADISSEDL